MQFNVKGWLETTKLKVSLLVGLVLNVSIVRLSVITSTFYNLFMECWHNEVDLMRWLK